MHGNGSHGIEIEIAVIAQEIVKQLGERVIEKVMTLELECVKETLERSAVVPPCIGPVDRQRVL
jgi:hypothetical protein